MSTSTTLDLGADDVHIDGAGGGKKKAMVKAPLKKKAKALAPPVKKPAGKGGVRVRAHLAPGGHLHIRQMSDAVGGSLICYSGLVALSDETTQLAAKGKAVWIQIAKVGSFKGHSMGPFDLTPEIFDQIVRNFKATENQRVAVDFEHASEQVASDGSIPSEGAPAQGWIIDLDNRGEGGLWGLVEWLEPALSYVKQGKYKFFSPAIRFNSRDRVTGKPVGARLTSGALTNQPFLDGMMPLVARDFDRNPEATFELSGDYCYSSNEYMPMIRYALRLPELSTLEDASEALAKLTEMLDAAEGDANGVLHGVYLADYLRPLREIVRAPMTATWSDVLEMVETLITQAASLDDDDDEGAEMNDQPGDDADNAKTSTTTGAGISDAITEINMSDAANLKDLETKNANLSLTLKEQEASIANLKLDLKDKDAKVVELSEKIVKLEKDQAAHAETLLNDKVNTAFETYKDQLKLTDEDKELMLIVAQASPEKFDKRYPRVPVAQRHMLRDLTGVGSEKSAQAPNAIPQGDAGGETILDIVNRLCTANSNLSRDAAFSMAEKELKKRTKKNAA